MPRDWSIYEKNQLMKYGVAAEDLAKYGEMPVEYITGHAEFDGLDFLVNETPRPERPWVSRQGKNILNASIILGLRGRDFLDASDKGVLIPRVESAQMLDEAEKLIAGKMEISFVEIGTGSGAIGISLYLRLKKRGARVMAVLSEISLAALAVARKNLKNLVDETDEIKLVESDLLEAVHVPKVFDLILANLPYIPTSRVPRLPESVVNYEPHVALDGGIEGLTLLKKLLVRAKNRVSADGALILEVDYSHDIPDFVEITGYQYEIVVDEFGQNRFLVARPRVI